MPNPTEVALVVAAGQRYDIWQAIEVERSYDKVVAEMRLTVAELSGISGGLSALKLKPNDPAQCYLAGRGPVISGYVYLRQAAYTADSHAVQIGIASRVQKSVISTVDANPGQYTNATLAQIAGAVLAPIGVGFSVAGSAAGASLPFERVSEHIGETRYQFIERLARFRNLQLIDDGQGNMLATQGPIGGVAAQLQEGVNIKRARLVLRIDETGDKIQVVGQNFGNDDHNADRARDVSATAYDGEGAPTTPIKICAEMHCSPQEAQLRVDREVAFNSAQYIDGVITVQGWLMAGGGLWIEQVGSLVTINSPMLVPSGTITLWIKGVIHRQSDEAGTETDVLVSSRLASGEMIETNDGLGDPSPTTSAPDPPDTSTPGAP